MKKGKGSSVFCGVAVGRMVCYRKRRGIEYIKGDSRAEGEKFRQALEVMRKDIRKKLKGLMCEAAEVLELQLILSEDESWLFGVYKEIEGGSSAPEAVELTGERLALEFASLEDEYMRERSADISELSHRISDILKGKKRQELPREPYILLAQELTPGETAELELDLILGIITQRGGHNGHSAMLARAYHIPTLVGADIELGDYELGAIDAYEGCWYIDPTSEVISRLSKKAEQKEKKPHRKEEKKPKVGIYANISSLEEARLALKSGCDGIGLFRSEFLYMNRTQLPTEEQQLEVYGSVARALGNKPAVFRTLDMGADKQIPYLFAESEKNPALGMRGIRFSLYREDIFRTQLRALYRASAYGNISIMFPMVSSVWELERARRICEEVREELGAQRIPLGVMIETPAAALCSRELGMGADFFSVGTNDLIQYTLAIDRESESLNSHYDKRHPAIMKMLLQTAESAKKCRIWAGVCGELAQDEEIASELIDMGYSELSVSPYNIRYLKNRLWGE